MQKEQPDIKTLSLSEFKIDIRWKAHLNLRKLRPIKNLIFIFKSDILQEIWQKCVAIELIC